MVSLAEVENTIKEHLPDARVKVEDLTGGGDHLQATVISELFAGKTRVKQHQLVYSALETAIASEAIHALALKTYTPETWAATGQSL